MKPNVQSKQITANVKAIVTKHDVLDACDLMGKIKDAKGNLLRRDIMVPLLSRTTVIVTGDKGKRVNFDLSDANAINVAFGGDTGATILTAEFASEVNFGFISGMRKAETASSAEAEPDADPSSST